jgi:hypothetical protein
MHGPDLYRKYRQLIVELADERRSPGHSLMDLHGVLQEFQETAATLDPGTADFVRHELANQLEHEVIRSINKHRRDILSVAVKAFDTMTFPKPKHGLP